MSNHKHLIVGNWKMNPGTLAEAKKIALQIKRIAPELKNSEIVVAPPFPFISACAPRKPLKNFHMGSQSASHEEAGPYTGEVSAAMLRDIGVEYVIVGHSEERKGGDTDLRVSEKMRAVLESRLIPIVCVGEATRDDGGAYLETLKIQIKSTFDNIPPRLSSRIILAYEPIWAIGAKEAMRPDDIREMSIFVKKIFADLFGPDAGLKVKVLYGGSVNYRNAPEIMTIGKVDGLLVGRESVNAPGFIALLKAVDSID
jgi:triosephosphate isomerase